MQAEAGSLGTDLTLQPDKWPSRHCSSTALCLQGSSLQTQWQIRALVYNSLRAWVSLSLQSYFLSVDCHHINDTNNKFVSSRELQSWLLGHLFHPSTACFYPQNSRELYKLWDKRVLFLESHPQSINLGGFFLVLVQKYIFALVLVILESRIKPWILLTNSSPSLMSVSFEYL